MDNKKVEAGPASGAGAMVERYVATTIRVESLIARGLYWIAVLFALLALAWGGLIVNQTVRSGNLRDGFVYTAILIAIAAFIYFLGWGWRWLWSGRVDYLFARKRYGAPGRLENARQKVATVFSFWP